MYKIDVGGMAVYVQPSCQESIILLCRIIISNNQAIW